MQFDHRISPGAGKNLDGAILIQDELWKSKGSPNPIFQLPSGQLEFPFTLAVDQHHFILQITASKDVLYQNYRRVKRRQGGENLGRGCTGGWQGDKSRQVNIPGTIPEPQDGQNGRCRNNDIQDQIWKKAPGSHFVSLPE